MKTNTIWRSAMLMLLLSVAPVLGQGSPVIRWQKAQDADRINSVIFNPSGDTLISGSSDRLIHFWRTSDGALLRTFNSSAPSVHASSIESLAITPDGTRLASASYGVVKLWTVSTGAERDLTGHTDWVVSVAFSPDGQLLASASFDYTVKVWRVADGTLVKTLSLTRLMRAVAFSPDGSLLAGAGADAGIHLWRTSDWAAVRTLWGHTSDIYVLAFSPDGTRIASGGYDHTLKLWNVTNGALLYSLGGNGNVYGVAFTPDGTQLAYTDGEGNTIRIHRVSDGARLRLFDQNVANVQTVAFSPQGYLGYGRADNTVVLASIGGNLPPPPTNSWKLAVSVKGNGATQASPQPNDGNGGYLDGTVVQLTAVPGSGYMLASWGGSISDTRTTVSIIMDANKTVTATFVSLDSTEVLWQRGDRKLCSWYMNSPTVGASVSIANGKVLPEGWDAIGLGDFNGDGTKDILLQQTATRCLGVWYMNGAQVTGSAWVRNGMPLPDGWSVAAVGDLDNDGAPDLLLQHTSGLMALWLMDGVQSVGSALLPSVSTAWQAVAIADFDNDGQNDILWQSSWRSCGIWFMNGTQPVRKLLVRDGAAGGAAWSVVGAADFNEDGNVDVLWQSTSGQLAAWNLAAGEYIGTTWIEQGRAISTFWQLTAVK